jgi:hypothetical protein
MSDLPEGGEPIFRTCLDCGEHKPLGDFHVSPRRKYGRGSYCQTCFNERSKASYRKRMLETNGREVRAFIKPPAGHRRCPDCEAVKPLEEFPLNKSGREGHGRYCLPCHNNRGRENKAKDHGSTRDYHLKRRYGITDEEVRGIILAQRGGCGICGAPDPEHVDHDHVTGEVRGILCFKPIVRTRRCRPSAATPRLLTIGCNGGLGQFKDNIATMRNAIDYLKETSWQRVLVHPGVYRLRSPRRACLPSRSS